MKAVVSMLSEIVVFLLECAVPLFFYVMPAIVIGIIWPSNAELRRIAITVALVMTPATVLLRHSVGLKQALYETKQLLKAEQSATANLQTAYNSSWSKQHAMAALLNKLKLGYAKWDQCVCTECGKPFEPRLVVEVVLRNSLSYHCACGIVLLDVCRVQNAAARSFNQENR